MMSETFEIFLNNKLNSIHTCLPGKIVEYYGHEKRKCKVKPLVKLRTAQNQLIEIKPIDDVPVMFPSTAEMGLMFPVRKDDGVLLLFSESSLGNFLNSDSEAEADDMTRFSLADCIAIPGLWSFKTAPDMEVDEDSVVLKYLDSFIEITKDGDLLTNFEGDFEGTIKGDSTVTFDGNLEASIGGDLTVTCDGELSLEAGSLKVSSDSTTTTIEDSMNSIKFTSTGFEITDGTSKIKSGTTGLDLNGHLTITP